MKRKNKETRDIGDAKNAPCSVTGTSKLTEKKYSIHIPFEVMDFLGNDYVIVSPKRFSRIKAFKYLLSRHIDECFEWRTETQLYFSTLQRLGNGLVRQLSLLKTLHEMNVIDIKLILQVKMVSVNPTIVVTNLSKEELDKMAQVSLSQLPAASLHISL